MQNNIDKASIIIDKEYEISTVDPRLFGGFIEHMGRCVYGGIYDEKYKDSDENGFRKDVVKLVKELGISVVRYPGGNFVSGYNWEDGVGPVENRPKRLDLAWECLETNKIGIHEFDKWCNKADTKIMMCLNLGTRGIEEAKNLFEYCNHDKGAYWSDLRHEHLHPNPYNIKIWCLGNEMDGPWQICAKSAEEYGKLAAETAKMLKRIDPNIETIVCGSSEMTLESSPEWDATVVEICHDYIDYLSIHMYLQNKYDSVSEFLSSAQLMETYIHTITSACDYASAIKNSNKKINLSFNEWNVIPGVLRKNSETKWIEGPRLCEGNYTMADALVFGSMLLSLLRHSDRIKIACLAQLINVFGPIMTPEDGSDAWKQTTYYPFFHVSKYGRGTVIDTKIYSSKISTKEFGDVDMLDSISVINEDMLTIFAINRNTDAAMEMDIKLFGFSGISIVFHQVLHSENIMDFNSQEERVKIVPYNQENFKIENGILKVLLQKASWNVVRINIQTT